jgi:hypothetical protein
MRLPQLLVYETDGRLAELLKEPARNQRWSLHKPRLPSTCLRLLGRGGPTVLVLKVGRDLKNQEMQLLDRATWLFPDTATVVVSDVDDPALAGLAWDLGASLVLLSGQVRDQLVAVVIDLMDFVIGKHPSGERGLSSPY